MNSYYETMLRNLYTPAPSPRYIAGKPYEDVEVILEVYENEPKERNYIILVLEDYIHGANRYQTKRRFLQNIICPFLRQRKMEAERAKLLSEIMGDEEK